MARMRAPERRRQLLESSVELFGSKGYRGATTAELARAAGVTEPILYRHFENKLDLFVTLVEEVGNEVLAAWDEALTGIDDPRERLERLLASNPATHRRGRSAYRVIFQAMSEADSDPEVARPLRRHLNRLHAFLRDELVYLQQHGAVRRDAGADLLARLLMDVAIGYGITAPIGGRGTVNAATRDDMQSLLAELIAK
ncbi:MAG: TetR/AcrR family transcriptional regulator [Phycisphaerales bacterium]|nr:TetR/AcrR family transcriptional regulator [Phycisphaerales bacterium]